MRRNWPVQIGLAVVNILGIHVCILLAFWLRYGNSIPEFNFSSYRAAYAPLTFLYLLSLAVEGVFQPRFRSYMEVLRYLFKGILLGTLLSVAFLYVFRSRWASFPTSVFVLFVPLAGVILFVLNSGILRAAGCIRKSVLIIGDEKSEVLLPSTSRIRKIHCESVDALIHQPEVDEVILCRRISDEKQFNLLVCLLLKSRVNVVFSPELYTEMMSVSGLPAQDIELLSAFLGRRSETEEFLMRLLDIVGSSALLLLLFPLMVLIGLLVKATSPGPVFYKQIRAGKNGVPFVLYKFRTMVNNAEAETGPVWATRNDARVTPLGRFLRQGRLDELPQLWNVLQGQMSLVGPRPERPHFLEEYPVLRGIRLAVRPGLTGLAQIRRDYDLKPHHKIRYDYLYIQRRSFLLNLYLMLKTVPVILRGRGV
ncbi:MAG TPA: exopolysaccharide biosynthesis polyprenyl glycosylphosphotransferase [Anaerohalosphaeraceae bacterium]|nr:exopolysaccharide biosynthesis polyprenyl glycosylphosphotransferase [Anaerohalosphaeraceae bacterium]